MTNINNRDNNIKRIILLLKGGVKLYQRDIFIAVCMVLAAFIGYNVGRHQATQKSDAIIQNKTQTFYPSTTNGAPTQKANIIKATPQPQDQRVVASKKAKSMLYHYIWCSGAKKIKEENKLWFDNAEAAKAAGYSLAGNCTE